MDRGYINIAIIKYWGKKNFNPYLIPFQGSVSIRSNRLYTDTEILSSDEDEFYLNGIKQNEKETKKVFDFVDKIIPNRSKLKINSINSVPTAAGLASSASAYCALTKALNSYFNLNLSIDEMSKISTQGSGSAGRSFYNICAFDKEGNIYELNTDLNLKMLAIVVSKSKKKIPSRDAMKLSVETSSIFNHWVERANDDFEKMKIYLKNNDFEKVGKIMEANTITMHNTTFKSNPSFSFLTKETYEVIKKIKRLRNKYGVKMYFTMDAGPNVKILYLKEDEEKILKILSENIELELLLC